MGKIYYAKRCQLGATIGVREGDKTATLRHVVRHSPTGLEWGYGGSGPGDTALSILVDFFGGWLAGDPYLKANRAYMDFKWAFIASAPKEGFEITSDQIEEWLEKRDLEIQRQHKEGCCPCEICQSRL